MAAHPRIKIKLSKGSASETGEGELQSTPSESRTISCPNHLVLADLPVGRTVGGPPRAALVVKTVGRKASRSLGERVHFCLKCDFPIAVYGRLSPCTHVFCLDCAQSGSSCYVCEKTIEKIQSIKRGEPLFICSAHLCLKSFTAMVEFESHVEEVHSESLNNKKESDAIIQLPAAASSASTTVRVPPVLPKPAADSASTTVRVPPALPMTPAFASSIPVVQIYDRKDTPLPPLRRDETYSVPVLMRQPRPPLFEPALAPSPNVQQAFHGAAFDMGRMSLGPRDHGPSVLGHPPNLQAQPWNMGLLPTPRGVPPLINPPVPHPRQPSRNHSPRRRQPHHSRPRNN